MLGKTEIVRAAKKYSASSPGLVVMGGYSCSKGRGFQSRYHLLDGHFSHIFVAKKLIFEKTKINEKEAHFKKYYAIQWPTFIKEASPASF